MLLLEEVLGVLVLPVTIITVFISVFLLALEVDHLSLLIVVEVVAVGISMPLTISPVLASALVTAWDLRLLLWQFGFLARLWLRWSRFGNLHRLGRIGCLGDDGRWTSLEVVLCWWL